MCCGITFGPFELDNAEALKPARAQLGHIKVQGLLIQPAVNAQSPAWQRLDQIICDQLHL